MAQRVYRVIVLGDSGVGKTSIITRACGEEYNPDPSISLGIDCKVKKMVIGDDTCLMTIWDTAGQERFQSLARSLYRGTHGIFLAYDVSSYDSFQKLARWEDEIVQKTDSPEVVKIVLANKLDLVQKGAREVSKEEGTRWAHDRGLMYAEVSAKSNDGMSAAFNMMMERLLAEPSLGGDIDTYTAHKRPTYVSKCC